MKKSIASLGLISLLFVASSLNGLAQDITGGSVEYDQLYYHTFEKRKGQEVSDITTSLLTCLQPPEK